MIEICRERPEHITAVQNIIEQAFGRSQEAELAKMLRDAQKAPVSLVALTEGRVAGHIMFSPITIDSPWPGGRGLGLAPLAVLPDFQRRGIGSELVRAGLAECRRAGHDFVVVLGDPGYYLRFGFLPGSDFGLGNEYGVGEHFMAIELKKGALEAVNGLVRYPVEFAQAGS